MAAVSVSGVDGGATGDQGSDSLAVAFQQMAQGLAGIQEAVHRQETTMLELMRQQDQRMEEGMQEQERSMQETVQQQGARIQELLQQQKTRGQESLQQHENRMQEILQQKIHEIMSQHQQTVHVLVRQGEETMHVEVVQLEGNGALAERVQEVGERSAIGKCQLPSSGEGESVSDAGGRAAMGHLEGRMTKLESAVQRTLETVFPRVEALVAQLEKPSPPTAPPSPTTISTSSSAAPFSSAASASSDPLSPGSPVSRDILDGALSNAAVYGELDDVREILDAGADVNCRRSCGATPLLDAAMKARVGVVALLLERGADVNARNTRGTSALHVAAINHLWGRRISVLIAGGALVDARDVDGWTPLHFAAHFNRTIVVNALLEAGASKTLEDNKGKTPYDYARKENLRKLLRPWE